MKRIVDNRPLPVAGTQRRSGRLATTATDRQRTSSRGRRA
jgi:hypothetical protein